MIIAERRYDDENVAIDELVVVEEDPMDTDEARDENGMTSDDRWAQLEDDNRVVTSGRGSRVATNSSDTGTNATGYSSGVGSGTPD